VDDGGREDTMDGPMEVVVVATGQLGAEDRRELLEVMTVWSGHHVVLRGRVQDQAELMGVLDRLRRAGLTVLDIDRVRDVEGGADHEARITVAEPGPGRQAGDVGADDRPTSTVAVGLRDQDELFDVLARLRGRALELQAVHVRPTAAARAVDDVGGSSASHTR
jgi:hypothetical protein